MDAVGALNETRKHPFAGCKLVLWVCRRGEGWNMNELTANQV